MQKSVNAKLAQDVLFLTLPFINLKDLPKFLCVQRAWYDVLKSYEVEIWKQFYIGHLNCEQQEMKREIQKLTELNSKDKQVVKQIKVLQQSCKSATSKQQKIVKMNSMAIKTNVMEIVQNTVHRRYVEAYEKLFVKHPGNADEFFSKWNTLVSIIQRSRTSVFYKSDNKPMWLLGKFACERLIKEMKDRLVCYSSLGKQCLNFRLIDCLFS